LKGALFLAGLFLFPLPPVYRRKECWREGGRISAQKQSGSLASHPAIISKEKEDI